MPLILPEERTTTPSTRLTGTLDLDENLTSLSLIYQNHINCCNPSPTSHQSLFSFLLRHNNRALSWLSLLLGQINASISRRTPTQSEKKSHIKVGDFLLLDTSSHAINQPLTAGPRPLDQLDQWIVGLEKKSVELSKVGLSRLRLHPRPTVGQRRG